MSFKGRLNRYTCNVCGKAIVTVDRDEGTTPFAIDCYATDKCKGYMSSAFYNGVEGDPTHEWRLPSIAEFNRLKPWSREHVRKGGLVLYPIHGHAA